MSSNITEQAQALADRIAQLSPSDISKPTLVYFDIVGICWPIRALLHIKGIDYDLIKVPIELWIYRQPDGTQPLIDSFPNGHIPLYIDSGICLNQSNMIMTHLAEQHDLFGDSAAEELAIREIMAHAYDALFHWSGLLQIIVTMNIPADVVEARLQAFLGNGAWGLVTDRYRSNLDPFERYLSANPNRDSGFIVGSRLSIADLHAFNVLCNWYKAFDRDLFVERYPGLDAYVQRIAAIPKVADYITRLQEPTTWFPLPPLGIRLTRPEALIGLTAAR